MKLTKIITLVLTLFFVGTGSGQAYSIGDKVELKSSKPSGVPIHSTYSNSFIGRVDNGSTAEIIGFHNGKHWIQVKIPDNREAWIIEKYVAGIAGDPTPNPNSYPAGTGAWSSAPTCEQALQNDQMLSPSAKDEVKMATWNIRWFPDNTNLSWLACSIAWMNLDVIAVQEIRNTQQAKTAMASLLSDLNRLTDGTWKYDLHDCGGERDQHVGYIWNASKVRLSGLKDMWEMNSRANSGDSPCKRRMRPGVYAYIEDLDTGLAFHAITVHSKSFPSQEAMDERFRTLDRIDLATAKVIDDDKDLIILGDFNTMGNKRDVTGPGEIKMLKAKIATEAPGFKALPVRPGCSEYYNGHGGWLDHVIVSNASAGITVTDPVAEGYCGMLDCRAVPDHEENMPAAYDELSDHCPIVFTVKLKRDVSVAPAD